MPAHTFANTFSSLSITRARYNAVHRTVILQIGHRDPPHQRSKGSSNRTSRGATEFATLTLPFRRAVGKPTSSFSLLWRQSRVRELSSYIAIIYSALDSPPSFTLPRINHYAPPFDHRVFIFSEFSPSFGQLRALLAHATASIVREGMWLYNVVSKLHAKPTYTESVYATYRRCTRVSAY